MKFMRESGLITHRHEIEYDIAETNRLRSAGNRAAHRVRLPVECCDDLLDAGAFGTPEHFDELGLLAVCARARFGCAVNLRGLVRLGFLARLAVSVLRLDADGGKPLLGDCERDAMADENDRLARGEDHRRSGVAIAFLQGSNQVRMSHKVRSGGVCDRKQPDAKKIKCERILHIRRKAVNQFGSV